MFITPIEQDNPVRRRPLMMYALAAAMLVAFGASQYLMPWGEALARFGFVPAAASWPSALSSLFLHAGYLHLLGNLFFFWMFADNVEDVLGPFGLLAAFLACGLAGATLHFASDTASPIPCIGASGAISGVFGLYVVFFRYAHVDIAVYLRQWRVYVFHGTALAAGAAWLGEQATLATLSLFTSHQALHSVSFWAHAGGGAAGLALGALLRLAGIRAQPPAAKLRFERRKASAIWCPYCGTPEAEPCFGEFRCRNCGTCYEVARDDSRIP